MNTDTRPTVEGGLLIAILLLLGLASVYIPVLGVVIEFFWALPIIVLTVRQGVERAVTALVAAAILLSLLVGPLLAIRLALSFGIVGLAIGCGIRQKHSAVRIFLTTLGAAFVAQILTIALLFFVMDIDIVETQTTMIREAFEESFAMYGELGIDQSTLDEARANLEPTVSLATMLMPTIVLLVALLNTAASFWASRLILKKLEITLPEFPKFAEWRFPIGFLYLMGFALVGMYWGATRELDLLYQMSINSNFLAMSVGFIQGLSLMSFAADRFKLSKFMRRLIFIVVLLNGILLQAVAFTGLFDMYFDYRRRVNEKK